MDRELQNHNTTIVSENEKRRHRFRLVRRPWWVWAILLIVLANCILAGWLVVRKRQKPTPVIQTVKATNLSDNATFKNAKTTDEKAVLVGIYSAEGKYEQAAALALDVAKSTSKSDDWFRLLQIAGKQTLKDKDSYLNQCEKYYATQKDTLDFESAYLSAEIFEQNGRKSIAAGLYSRAVATHDDAPRDEYTKSKDELSKKVTELGR